MANTTKSTTTATRKSTAKAATKKAGTQKATKAPAPKKPKEKKVSMGDAVRELLVKEWPNKPTVEAVQKAVPAAPKNRILMYRGAVDRTLRMADRLGKLKK